MSPEERTQLKDYYHAAPVILPLLEGMHKVAFSRLMGKQRDGERDNEMLIAELYIIDTLKRKFEQNYQTYLTLEERNGKSK